MRFVALLDVNVSEKNSSALSSVVLGDIAG